ncbi:MAG: T9SS type A sorting domain-containing protein, partial [candidate division WOR-3 bacterium]|nr:T9SS type A sorting domain-containing protein [candidate division WOR-3 bacterium]
GAYYPSVAFEGTNYFVVWMDGRNGNFDIYGARVSRSGVVLDPQGIPISTAPFDQIAPGVKFDGVNYLVTWTDCRYDINGDIYAARVTQAGVVLDSAGIAVSTVFGFQFIFRGIGVGSTNYLLVWFEDRDGDEYLDIYGARLTRTGVVLDPMGIAISVAPNNQYAPSVAFDGTNYFVVWTDDRLNSGDYRIFGARVTQTGVVLDPQGIQISQNLSLYATVVFNNTLYFVVWAEAGDVWESDIFGARVTQAGVVLDPQGIPISTIEGDQWLPVVVFDNVRYFIAWADLRSWRDYDIYGTRVTLQNTVLDPNGILLTYGYSSPEQYSPRCAYDGTNYFVVWQDSRNNNAIYGTRVTPSGVVLDPQGIQISPSDAYNPAVIFDGTNYFVVWEDYRYGWDSDIFGARVTQSGVVLDPQGIPISTAPYEQYSPAIAYDGTNYFVVWTDNRDGDLYTDIYGARVSRGGIVLDPNGIQISSDIYDYYEQYSPAIAYDGTNYFVVWTIYRSGGYLEDIFGARVTPAGVVLDLQAIPISIALNEQYEPALAFDGVNYFVVWSDFRNSDSDIYGTRVTPTGIVLNPSGIPISTAGDDQWWPAVAFDGTKYLVVWTDYRNGDNYDIYGARVNTAGGVLDPQGLELINRPYDRCQARLTRGPGNQLLLVFTGYVAQYGVSKILGAFYPSAGVNEGILGEISSGKFKVFPNPCYKDATIELTLTKATELKIELIDISGRVIKRIVQSHYPSGSYKIRLDLDNLPGAVYFLRIKSDKKVITERLIKIK